MKQLIIMLLVSTQVNAQYLGVKVYPHSVGVEVGYLSRGDVQLSATAMKPLMNSLRYTSYTAEVGKKFDLTYQEQDNFNLTLTAGYAYLKHNTLVKAGQQNPDYGVLPYDTYHKENISTIVLRAEVGKDMHVGRFLIGTSYSKQFQYYAGLRLFINR